MILYSDKANMCLYKLESEDNACCIFNGLMKKSHTTILLTDWGHVSFALSHRYDLGYLNSMSLAMWLRIVYI